MVAFDSLEQLHAATLQPEYADAIADIRPFDIQIRLDERVRQRPHLQPGGLDVAPFDLARSRQGDCAGQRHRPARKEAKMLCSLSAAPWLVEQAAIHADHAVAADHPIVALDAASLEGRKLRGDLLRILESSFDRILIDHGLDCPIIDPRRVEHLAADGACGSENQDQSRTLWKSRWATLTRAW